MNKRFEGKVVIVTGAASGIGEAAARQFSAEGAKVVLVDRQGEPLEKVAGELASDRTLAHVADVSSSRAVDDMVASGVTQFGRLDVLVNNAGVHEGRSRQSYPCARNGPWQERRPRQLRLPQPDTDRHDR
jgi:meso-butanediol dehydrogenase / (S,S)-butanediol dehydrogenase / diacetyl reductase